jgi:glutathione S-transferase
MSILLHGVNASPFVRKVRVALSEKNIPYELKPQVPFGQPPEYLKISPLGKIPCFQDGDYTLPDSSCIIAYLERTNPRPALYPEDPKEYGRALFLEEYADSKLVEIIGAVFFQRVVRKLIFKQESDETIVRKKIDEEAPKVFDWLESQIGGDREWLVGTRFGIADLAMASPFVNFSHAGESVDAKRWPRLAAYLQRVHARPSFKALIEEERQSFKPA